MKKILYSVLILGVLSMAGCQKGFLDINKNPYDVTEPNLAKLLTGLERYIILPDNNSYINMGMPSFNNWLSQREVNNYDMGNSSAYLTNTWEGVFAGTIPQSEKIIKLAEEKDCMLYAGIAKLVKAYTVMCLVDLWGDIPYTELNNPESFPQPRVDKSEDIYNAIIALVEEAGENLNNATSANPEKPANDDLIYKGDKDKWIKFANTLKLRMLVQSRKAKDQITDWSSKLNALLAENNFMTNGEDFQFPHSTTKAPADERHQSYVNEYAGGQKTYHISPWFYEIMKGMTLNFPDNPFSGIVDPRIPYYFYNQATAAMAAANKTDYRDGAFISIMYNSNSGFEGGAQERVWTCVGIYPVGGRYDDGGAESIGENSGTGVAPNKMLQAYSVPFMKAELYLTEGISGDAAAALKEGIEKSFFHVNAVSQAAKGTMTVPEINTTAGAGQTFLTEVLSAFNAASNEKKLEILMTQKWIANFYNSFEAYADIRRTGYPKLMFDVVGETVKSPYKQETAATPGVTEYYLKAKAKFPRVLEYSNTETASNENISNGRDITAKGNVFWDK